MMSHKPNFLLANGDFVNFNHLKDLTAVFQKISEAAIKNNIPKKNIFITPGNWEHTLNASPRLMNYALKAYGTLVTESYHKMGTFELEVIEKGNPRKKEVTLKKKIWMGHYPQFIIPANALPPEEFLYTFYKNQAHLLVTMDRKTKIPPGTDLVVYSHTHVRAAFYDKATKTLIINPGGLDTKRKAKTEICSFAIYDTSENSVSFFNSNNGEKIGRSYPLKYNDSLKVPSPLQGKQQLIDDPTLLVNIYDMNSAKRDDENLGKIENFLKLNGEKVPKEGNKIKWIPPINPLDLEGLKLPKYLKDDFIKLQLQQ